MLGSVNTAKPSQVRVFLRADSAEELVRLQLLTNVKLMGRADYTDIQFVDGFWYAWFLVDVDKYPEILEGLNGTKSRTRRPRTR
jgi:hypothetical protein